MEINPIDFEGDEEKYCILQQNEAVRREIFADLLKVYLEIDTQKNPLLSSPSNSSSTIFKNAFFLGRYEVSTSTRNRYNNYHDLILYDFNYFS